MAETNWNSSLEEETAVELAEIRQDAHLEFAFQEYADRLQKFRVLAASFENYN